MFALPKEAVILTGNDLPLAPQLEKNDHPTLPSSEDVGDLVPPVPPRTSVASSGLLLGLSHGPSVMVLPDGEMENGAMRGFSGGGNVSQLSPEVTVIKRRRGV